MAEIADVIAELFHVICNFIYRYSSLALSYLIPLLLVARLLDVLLEDTMLSGILPRQIDIIQLYIKVIDIFLFLGARILKFINKFVLCLLFVLQWFFLLLFTEFN